MENELNPFILSTAKDYDMDYAQVEKIYNSYGNCMGFFYNELEDFIKNRANK